MRCVCLSLLIGCAAIGGGIAGAATIDVTSYGATPGGGANDAAPINAAIAAAAPGDTVFIPAGTFDISARIVTKSNITLAGAGAASTILRYSGNSAIQLLGIENASNVTLNDFTLDANNSQKPTQGIYARNSSNLNLQNLAIKNFAIKSGFSPHGIYFDTNVTNSVIANNTISNIGTQSSWGAGIRLGHGSSFNQVLGNTISSTGRGGILANDGSTDLVIRNNIVTGSGGTGLGIELWNGCHRAIVEDNRIDHWLSIDASNNLAVRRNVVSDKTGVYKYAGLELVDSSDNVFTDNVVDGGQKLGISISGPLPKQRVLWARNAIKTASTWGIQIQGETGKASRQYFYRNSFQYTIRSGSNTLYSPQGHGVRFNGDADHIVFDSNLIDSNLGQGVQLVGGRLSDLVFTRNTITNNALAALENAGVTNLTWTDNTVTGNGNNNQPASVLAMTAFEANVGEPVEFSLDMLRPAGRELAAITTPITNMLWDFGQGLPSTSFNPTHTWTAPGAYFITALSWDAAGNAQLDQASVTVVPEPSAGLTMLWLAGLIGRRSRRKRGERPRRGLHVLDEQCAEGVRFRR